MEIQQMFEPWQLAMMDDAGYNGIRDEHMAYQFNCDVDKYFVFHRSYEWNYKNKLMKIKGGE